MMPRAHDQNSSFFPNDLGMFAPMHQDALIWQ